MGSPDHLEWLPKFVGRLLALLVILPLARKNKQEFTGGGSSASAPGSTRTAWRQHGQGASLKPSPQKKENKQEKRRALCLHHHNVSCVPGGGSCGPPNLPHIPPANGSSRMPLSTGGGGNVARPTCHTYHPPCPDHGGGYEDPTSLHLGLSGQMGQYVDCQFLGHAIVNKRVGIAVEKVVYGFPCCF